MKPVKPLTAAEKKWLQKLEDVMSECPSERLQCYTTGDHRLTFYDRAHAQAWELDNGYPALDAGELHEAAGSKLKIVSGSFVIDSCAG